MCNVRPSPARLNDRQQVISEDDFDMLFPHKSCSWSPDGDKANYYYSYENLVKAYHR